MIGKKLIMSTRLDYLIKDYKKDEMFYVPGKS